jgi:sterol desaturase/sphingolipid hydroxylase (fatty acid hydroxylase superfamily)
VSHWLCHRIPPLWELHKVHHSAEVLTPLTLFRVHPIEGVLFANILAVAMGAADAVLTLAFGSGAHAFAPFDRNVLALAGLYLVQHLQHTEFWVMAPGPLRKLIHSPAHHQIHHSENPAHYGKNLGGLLTVWDWVFGTLLTPDANRPALTFGLGPEEPNHRSVGDAMVRPMLAALPIRRRGA